MQRSTMPWTNAVPLLRDTFVIHIIPGSHNGCGIFVPSLNASINSNKETQPLPMYQNSPVPALDIKRNADDVAVVPRVHICNGPQVLVLPVSSCMSSSARKRRISPPSSTLTLRQPVLGQTPRPYASLSTSHNPRLHTFHYMNTPMIPRQRSWNTSQASSPRTPFVILWPTFNPRRPLARMDSSLSFSYTFLQNRSSPVCYLPL